MYFYASKVSSSFTPSILQAAYRTRYKAPQTRLGHAPQPRKKVYKKNRDTVTTAEFLE